MTAFVALKKKTPTRSIYPHNIAKSRQRDSSIRVIPRTRYQKIIYNSSNTSSYEFLITTIKKFGDLALKVKSRHEKMPALFNVRLHQLPNNPALLTALPFTFSRKCFQQMEEDIVSDIILCVKGSSY